MTSIWIIGESDDHLEAAFTTEAAADAYLAKIRDRDGNKGYDHWWIREVHLDPAAPRVRDSLQGLGGFGTK